MTHAGAQAVGVDVGGTKISALRVGASGEIHARETTPTPADDMTATLEAMVGAARAVVSDQVVAVGIAAAGMVDPATGVLHYSPNLAWREAPLVGYVSDAVGLPVVADNDSTAAGFAELKLGAARGHAEVLFIAVGTGIGGCIITGGRVMHGAHGFAGEVGHMVVEPDGPECGCGNRGCWETLASGLAILRAGRSAVRRHSYSGLAKKAGGDPQAVTGEMVTEAAAEGDPTACGILVEVGHRLGQGIAGLVNTLDPEMVVVGGGASDAGDLLLEPARKAFRMTVEAYDRRPDVPIVPAELRNDAGAVGAALLALEGEP
jgi:glucokinase